MAPHGFVAQIKLEGWDLGGSDVLSFQVSEKLSQPFTAQVEFVAPAEATLDRDLLGKTALLSFNESAGIPIRFVHGIVLGLNTEQAALGERPLVRATIGPRLSRLGLGRGNRIFQRKTVPDIAKLILDQHQVPFETRFSVHYDVREYCVQYGESDLAFLQRLFEEEGIYYYFFHEEEGHKLVLTDSASGFHDVPGEVFVPFRAERGLVGTESIFDVQDRHVLTSQAVSLLDFNYLTPSQDMRSNASEGDTALEIYEHHGRFETPAIGKKRAKIRLEQHRAVAELVQGLSDCKRFLPGARFKLEDHPSGELNKQYVLTSVAHQGRQPSATDAGSTEPQPLYQNDFTCIPSTVIFRAPGSTPRPVIAGPQTATVVGPSGEEIFTDELGRIKIQFHWDREGQRNDNSSCWVRVSSGWAGAGFGAIHIPRIGQEVVVEFIEGDPDRPLITGSVYNGNHPPPLNLPSEKTRTTLRTASSPGGGGFNEIRFEDASGSEELFVHSQKDFNSLIENDHTEEVKGHQTIHIKKNRTRVVDQNQTVEIKGNDTITVDGNQGTTITKNRSNTISGNDSETVAGSQSSDVGGAHSLTVGSTSTETVGAAKSITVGAALAVTVGAAMSETVGGGKAEAIGGAKSETVGGSKSETVGSDHSLDVGGNATETVGGNKTLDVGKEATFSVGKTLTMNVKEAFTVTGKEITLAAEEQITFAVGSASLVIKKNGDIVIKGGKVQVTANGDLVIKGNTIAEN